MNNSGTEMLLGSPAMERAPPVPCGRFGTVGSWCAEALARAGIGQLTLVDHAQVGLTQPESPGGSPSTHPWAGETAAMAQRIQDINPNCILHLIPEK